MYHAVGWIKNEITPVLYTCVFLMKLTFAQLYKKPLAMYGINFHYCVYKTFPPNNDLSQQNAVGHTIA
jgi:hypothetical protein